MVQASSMIALLLLPPLCWFQSTVANSDSPRNSIVLVSGKPDVVVSGMNVDLEVLRPEGLFKTLDDVRAVFRQGGASVVSSPPTGSSIEVDRIRQSFNLTVPDGLVPGKCQVVLEIGQERSQPLELEVAMSAPPPIVTSAQLSLGGSRQRPAQPGDSVAIKGTNLGYSDEAEILDSTGAIHRVRIISNSSSATLASFTLPEGLADGKARFSIVENRSGMRQRSKTFTIRVLDVPLAPGINTVDLAPLAPGQWLNLSVYGFNPSRADRVEFAFLQNGATTIIPFTVDSSVREWRMQIPETLVPGEAFIQTRGWRKDKPSDWAAPLRYQVLEHPAPPAVWRLQRITAADIGRDVPQISLDSNPPAVVTVEAGDKLWFTGRFPVRSVTSLRVKLSGNQATVVIKPNLAAEKSRYCFEAEIPVELTSGEWKVVIAEIDSNTSLELPLLLRVR